MSKLKAKDQWPSIAQDMALLTIPNSPVEGIEDICQTYGISKADLKEMLAVPYFQKLFEKSLSEVQSLGNAAGMKYRAMILSQAMAETLFRKFNEGAIDIKEALKLLELLFKASGLDKDNSGTQVNVQANIALPLPKGVDKVAQFIPVEA